MAAVTFEAEEASWLGSLFARMAMGAEEILIENPEESAWLQGMRGAPDGGFYVANQYTAPEAMVKYLDQMAQANIKHAIKEKGIRRGDGRDAEVEDIVWKEYVAQLYRQKQEKDEAELKKKRRELWRDQNNGNMAPWGTGNRDITGGFSGGNSSHDDKPIVIHEPSEATKDAAKRKAFLLGEQERWRAEAAKQAAADEEVRRKAKEVADNEEVRKKAEEAAKWAREHQINIPSGWP